MKTIIKDIRWDYDFDNDKELTKRFNDEKQKEYEAFMEDWDGEEKFEEVFDEEAVKAELLATKKGLPSEAFMIEYSEEETKLYDQRERQPKGSKKYRELSDKIKELEMPSEEKIKAFLENDKGYKVLSFTAEKASKDTDLTKIMFKDGINQLFSKCDFQKYLDLTANFSKYSLNNRMLVYAQNPDATIIKGKSQWKLLERYPSKGAKAIWINPPVTHSFSIPSGASSQQMADAIENLRTFIDNQNKRIGNPYDFGYVSPEQQGKYEETLMKKGNVNVFTGYTSVAKVYDIADTFGKEIPVLENKKINIPNELLMALNIAYPSNQEMTASEDKISYLFNQRIAELSDIYLHGPEILVKGVNGTNANYSVEEMRAENKAIAYLVEKYFGLESMDIKDAFLYLRDQYDTTDEQYKVIKALSDRIEKTAQMFIDKIEENLKYTKGNIRITDMKMTYDREYFKACESGIPMAKYQDGKEAVATVSFTVNDNRTDEGNVSHIKYELYDSTGGFYEGKGEYKNRTDVMKILQYEEDTMVRENEIFKNSVNTPNDFIATVVAYTYIDKDIEEAKDKTYDLDLEEDEIER